MAIFPSNKKSISFRELKQQTKNKGWISKQDREALLKESKKYIQGGITKKEMNKKILAGLKKDTEDTVKRREIPKIKKNIL